MRNIAHIGIAVASLDEAIPLYRDILGLDYLGTETVPSEKVRVAFFQIGESQIELLEPTDGDSPIAKFLEKKGEGVHHIAFAVADINGRLQEIKEKGIPIILDTPKKGAHESLVAFLHPKATKGVLMELCQKSEK